MNRRLNLISLALVGAATVSASAQRTAPASFTPVSLLPAGTSVDEYSMTADGNRVYYSSAKGEVFLFDRKTSKTTRIADGGDIWDVTVARNGSAVAFTKAEGNDEYVWAVPLDPGTGGAKGPQRRVSMIQGDTPALS